MAAMPRNSGSLTLYNKAFAVLRTTTQVICVVARSRVPLHSNIGSARLRIYYAIACAVLISGLRVAHRSAILAFPANRDF